MIVGSVRPDAKVLSGHLILTSPIACKASGFFDSKLHECRHLVAPWFGIVERTWKSQWVRSAAEGLGEMALAMDLVLA